MIGKIAACLLLAAPAVAGGEGCLFRPGDDPAWAAPDLREDSAWQPVTLPHRWPDRASQAGWYRTSLVVPSRLRDQPLGLSLGVAASEEQVYFNGILLGGSGKFGPDKAELPENFPRLHAIPASAIHWDAPNSIAVRVHRNFHGPAGLLTSPPVIANLHELELTRHGLTFPFRVTEAVLLGGIAFGALLIGFVLCHRGNDGICSLFLLLSFLLAGGLIAESHGLHHLGLRNALTVRIGWACFNLAAPVTLLFLFRFLGRDPGVLSRLIVAASVLCALAVLALPDAAPLALPYLICQILQLGLAVSMLVRGVRSGTSGALPLAWGVAGAAACSALAMLEIGGVLPGSIPGMPQRSIAFFQAAILVFFLSILFAIAARFVGSSRVVRSLMHRALSVQDADRRRVARELHDGIGQELQALKMRVHMDAEQPLDHPRLEQLLGSLIVNVRRISGDLYPQPLNLVALGPAIESHLTELRDVLPFTVHQDISLRERLPDEHETHLFRIFQEGLHNTIKHADASNFHVSLHLTGSALRKGMVELTLKDDGKGFDPGVPGRGLGLHSIRERAEALGGTSLLRSSTGKGSRIVVRAPVERQPQPD
jgi:signal transduction histidine kinase